MRGCIVFDLWRRDKSNVLPAQRPRFANRHGRLYEANTRSFLDLAEHDIRVAVVNITAGSMNAPFYNTRSVKVAYVLDGEGEPEIVYPHMFPHMSPGGRGGESEERRRERGKGNWREEEEEEEEQKG
ncbi:63 kDa globulin-like protein [Oryza sativa Japonica Group]|uniref:63 kDa globulin-like protein n=1 Tax=Oryza sativa subsp. japonica TaxID=39947 RepID=UPI00339CE9AC